MVLIRGIGGLFPCPGCLVPSKEQLDLSKQWPIRKIEDVKPIVENQDLSFTAKNNLLKQQSWRPIYVGISRFTDW